MQTLRGQRGLPPSHRARVSYQRLTKLRASAAVASQPEFFVAACPEASPRVVFHGTSDHNSVVRVLEIPDHPLVDSCISELKGCRVLLLDDVGNIHSIWKPDVYLTNSYWDFLATLPSLSPEGPIGILGLAAGTIARMIHAHYPERQMMGWELDPVVLTVARLHMGLAEIEASGQLTSIAGDALVEDPALHGTFAGIMVDMFSQGTLVEALTLESTWQGIKLKLKPNVGARVMVNLGQSPIGVGGRSMHPDAVATVQALQALVTVFGEVSVLHIRNMDGNETQNTVALTGPFEGLQSRWQSQVPEKLREVLNGYTWESCHELETTDGINAPLPEEGVVAL